MAIRDLLWACPNCGTFGALRNGGNRSDLCSHCGTRFRRGEGALIDATHTDGRTETADAAAWLGRLPAIEERYPPGSPETLGPEPVRVRTMAGFRPVMENGELLGWAERMGPKAKGTVSVTPDALVIQTPGSTESTPLSEIRSVQPTSSSLQIGRRGRPLVAIKLSGASIRLWEAVLRIRVREAYRTAGYGEIVEFQPVIRTGAPTAVVASSGDGGTATGSVPLAADAPVRTPPTPTRPERTRAVYRFCRWVMRKAWERFGEFDIRGTERVPASGPFLLVCNHQSDLDPPLIQSIIPRPVYAVAKSGLFTAAGLGWLVRRLHCIPVRRYQVDPQSVRTALRKLEQGTGVAIYIEGERCWDGRLQDYRPGTIRLALKAGVPVIPVAISGTYDASPRWDSRIRPGPVTIRFLEPIHFRQLDRRSDRDAALESTADLIMRRLAEALATP